MRIVDIRERTIRISRYADADAPKSSDPLTTSLVAVITDQFRDGAPVVGYGYSSVGRYGQAGLIRERFAPRLLAAAPEVLLSADGVNLDPARAWAVMMSGEKAGGHGERCVAVGTLDMALWDAAAKVANLPLYEFLGAYLGQSASPEPVPVYASGGYPYPHNDLKRLGEEVEEAVEAGFTLVKIKIGTFDLDADLRRVERAIQRVGDNKRLAVDAMNRYSPSQALRAVRALAPLGLAWVEDLCDPHDFSTQRALAELHDGPIAAGEALFSDGEANLLASYGGLRSDRDKLLFDPVHCYGIIGYLRIMDTMRERGWSTESFLPHGGHLFALHLVSALRLGAAEVNCRAFAPFDGPTFGLVLAEGRLSLPFAPGIGFETYPPTRRAFSVLGDR